MRNEVFARLSGKDIGYQLSNIRQIVFEVTDICNLRCKYCGYGEFYKDYDKRRGTNLDIKKAVKLLEYFQSYWKSNNSLSLDQPVYIGFYGGEPLINFRFIDQIVTYISKADIQGRHFKYSVTTNAILLDRYMDYLVEKNMNLLISLDGNKNNHSYRVTHSGKNSFNKIFSNVKLLKKKYPDYFKSSVNFNVVLHNRNSVTESLGFIKQEFGKTARISELNDTGIRSDKKKVFNQIYKSRNQSLYQSENYEQINKEMFINSPDTGALGIFLHHYSGNVFRSYNELLFDANDRKVLPTGTCLPFSKKMFITVNGKILPCERIGHQYALGKITNAGVVLDFEDIASRYNLWFEKIERQCKRCYNTKACIQCIFNMENLDGKPVCEGFMNQKHFGKYVAKQMEYLRRYPYLYKKIMEEVIIE